ASGGHEANRTSPAVNTSAEPAPGLLHSSANQPKPAAASSGPNRAPGRRSQEPSPAASSAHPAAASATRPSVGAPANEESRARATSASVYEPTAMPSPPTASATSTRRTAQSSHAGGAAPIRAGPELRLEAVGDDLEAKSAAKERDLEKPVARDR